MCCKLHDTGEQNVYLIVESYIISLFWFRNVSYPKVNEASHSSDGIIRLYLTDGHGAVSAIILDSIKGIELVLNFEKVNRIV